MCKNKYITSVEISAVALNMLSLACLRIFALPQDSMACFSFRTSEEATCHLHPMHIRKETILVSELIQERCYR